MLALRQHELICGHFESQMKCKEGENWWKFGKKTSHFTAHMHHIHKQTSRKNNGKYHRRAVTYVSVLQSGTLGVVVMETDVDNVSVSMLDGHKSMQKRE